MKQASRQWYKNIDSIMVNHDYKRTATDHCIYVLKFPNGNFINLLLYVDDMLVAGQNANMIRRLKDEFFKSFDLKDLGPAKQILGVKIVRDRKAKKLCLSQEKYVERVLAKFNMADAKTIYKPLTLYF